MISEFLVVVVSLFAIVDPLASISIFVSMFSNSSRKKQNKAAMEAVVAALCLLFVFAVVGLPLLTYLNISVPAFMIAGGLLLLFLAFEFVAGVIPKSRSIEKDTSDAVVPLGTPLLAGPGAITSVIFFTHIYGLSITLPAIIIVMVLSFFCYWGSMRINRIVGKNGLKILSRIMGLITAAIAVSLIEKALIAYGLISAVT